MAESINHFTHHHPPVHVWVRHTKRCKMKKNGRYFRGCGCPLWLETMCEQTDGQIQLSANTRDWVTADRLARDLESGAGKSAITEKTAIPSLRDAIGQFVDYKTNNKTAKVANPAPYRMILTRMADWLALRDVTQLADIKTWHLCDWRGTWKYKTIRANDGPNKGKELLTATWDKHTINVRAFFDWCVGRDYLIKSPAASEDFDLPTLGREQKPPFTVAEMKAILAAIDKLPLVTRGKNAYSAEHQARRTQMLRALILLMRWSGLSLQDALSLERHKLRPDNRLLLRRTKTAEDVFVKLPDHVADLLRVLPRDNGHFFWDNPDRYLMHSFEVFVMLELRRIFKIAGIKTASSHRFRHTFAVEGLNHGISYDDMARLLGHADSRTTRRYYDAWVESRQRKLEDVVVASWATQDMLQA